MTTFGLNQDSYDFTNFDASKDISFPKLAPEIFMVSPAEPEETSPESAHEDVPDDENVEDEEYPATQSQSQSQQAVRYNPTMELQNVIGVLQDERSQEQYLLQTGTRDVWSIGRLRHNFVYLQDVRISSTHCKITWNGGYDNKCELKLTDCSKNGTVVNGMMLSTKCHRASTILKHGDVIELGGIIRLVFKDVNYLRAQLGIMEQKYAMGHELGSGAFARVYRCIRRENGQAYAVKVLDKEKILRIGGPNGVTNVAREIEILQNLGPSKHPGIVALEDHLETDRQIYLVMELVEGGDGLSYIMNRGALPEEEVGRMAAQICQAVAFLHSQNIIHRDLKPENIMLTADNPPNCKVTDFGLSKILDGATFLRTMCGTPAYLAPEVMVRPDTDNVPYDEKVDSYSLGVIFFCMLTGFSPFVEQWDPNMNQKERISFFVNRTVNWRTIEDAQVSRTARNFIENLLVYEPRNRMSVTEALNHPWIRHLVGVDYYSSVGPTSSASDFAPSQSIDPPSQPMKNLNISDPNDMSIPGLGVATQMEMSETSVTANIPGAFPKARKQMEVIEEEQQPVRKRKSEYVVDTGSPLTDLSEQDEAGPSRHDNGKNNGKAASSKATTAKGKTTSKKTTTRATGKRTAVATEPEESAAPTPTRRSARGQPAAKLQRIS